MAKTNSAAALERVKRACNDVVTATSAALGLTAAVKARRARKAAAGKPAAAAGGAARETADVLHDRSKPACGCSGKARDYQEPHDAVDQSATDGATHWHEDKAGGIYIFTPLGAAAGAGSYQRARIYYSRGLWHVSQRDLTVKRLPAGAQLIRPPRGARRPDPALLSRLLATRTPRPNPMAPADRDEREALVARIEAWPDDEHASAARWKQIAKDAGIAPAALARLDAALPAASQRGAPEPQLDAIAVKRQALAARMVEQVRNASRAQFAAYLKADSRSPKDNLPGGAARDAAGGRRQRLRPSPPTAAVPVVPFIKCTRDEPAYRAALAAAKKIGPVRDARDVYRVLYPVLGKEDQEVFGVLMVDTRGQCIGWHEVCRGTRDAVSAPARLFSPIPTYAPHRYMIVHNHPTGQASPSPADRGLTVRMRALAAPYLPECVLVDHVIIGVDQCYSFSAGATAKGRWTGKLLRFTPPARTAPTSKKG